MKVCCVFSLESPHRGVMLCNTTTCSFYVLNTSFLSHKKVNVYAFIIYLPCIYLFIHKFIQRGVGRGIHVNACEGLT